MVRKGEDSVAVISLQKVFGIDTAHPRRLEPETLIFVEVLGRKYALQVDAVFGLQQIVVKHFEGLYVHGDLFSGAALMGDGRVALLLNLNALVSSFHFN